MDEKIKSAGIYIRVSTFDQEKDLVWENKKKD